MHVELFEDSMSGAVHLEFKSWRLRHPSGYFLNRRAQHDYMLHKSACGHIDPTIEDRATDARKVRAKSEADLRDWAKSEGHEVTACGSCSP
jgi:hypothetical protein